MHKTWNKPLHKRKWKSVSNTGKLIYYLQPLVDNLFFIWMQPLPFPTLLKIGYSCGLFFFLLLPFLCPLLVLVFYYGIFQYVAEQHLALVPPDNLDLLGAALHLWRFEVPNQKYLIYVTMYIDRYRVIMTAISSTIDYMRMALSFVFS
ncbi:uncharacterized protein [Drosophila kikkawai]|uniref:Uncharacterized protein isoform X2 n=1 Tax=Drosophila kikkawai TaxID=30033 RepID=A0A6P4JAN9_DROKI|nr:uncharacterized protein LOC108081818 isoform X2 [Drosophila kikkawai]